jgi:hypothetical protein
MALGASSFSAFFMSNCRLAQTLAIPETMSAAASAKGAWVHPTNLAKLMLHKVPNVTSASCAALVQVQRTHKGAESVCHRRVVCLARLAVCNARTCV